jgi:predicted amidohydrolase
VGNQNSKGNSHWKALTGAAVLDLLPWKMTYGNPIPQSSAGAQPIKVAAVDFVPAWGNLDDNIRRLVDAANELSQQGVDFAVFPEAALSGYLFSDFAQIAPFLDTIPGKTTAALLPALARSGMYMSVGIAERDAETGIAYNSAVLLGPQGIIGTYRKIGLNSLDQRVFAPGDTGVEVFKAPIGRIALIICYDNVYWQYARLAALRGAQIIAWTAVSARVTPGTPPAQAKSDHSTVANVQYMSAQNGVFVIGATRSGIETNPITGGKLYFNGGSSIWSPDGHKIAQGPVVGPEELAPGLNGFITATIRPADAERSRAARLALRRPACYLPLLTLHRSPVDANATPAPRTVSLAAAQWPEGPTLLAEARPAEGELMVLPALSALPSGLSAAEIKARAEPVRGAFENALAAGAHAGKGYLVGSYPERDGEKVFHTVVLAGPEGAILARYRVTHPNAAQAAWATPGDQITVVETPLGRIGLASAEELSVPEFGGLYAVLRTDILAAPAGSPQPLKVEIDRALYSVPNPPTDRADFFPYAAATLNQYWLVSGGRRAGDHTAAAIYGPDPVISTPTLIASLGEPAVRYRTILPAPETWINQTQLIDGQQAQWFPPLVLQEGNERLERWRQDSASARACR